MSADLPLPGRALDAVCVELAAVKAERDALLAAVNRLALAWANEDKVAQGLAFAEMCALAAQEADRG